MTSEMETVDVAQRPPAAVQIVRNATAAAPYALTLAIAATVWVTGRAHGAYYVSAWAPLGFLLLASAVALLVARRRPDMLMAVAAAALVALGLWSVVSILWGGLPNAALTLLGQSIVAGAALVVASAVTVDERAQFAVRAGVLLGLTLQAVEILGRVAVNGGPSSWFLDRVLEGPAGYHNAQATVFALGVPLAVSTALDRRVVVRGLAAAAAVVLVGALVLTQSRGGLLAAALGLVVLAAWARERRLLLFLAPVAAVGAALVLAERDVDAALVDGGPASHLTELRHFVVWCVLGAVVLAVVAAASAGWRRATTVATAVLAACVVAGAAVAIHERGAISRTAHRLTHGTAVNPDLAPAGDTRFTSLSLNGRREAWRLSWQMTKQEPLGGAGQGIFSQRWGTDRPTTATSNYVLQPHSIELELLAELGIVGLAAFVLFVGAVIVAAARATTRATGAVTGAMLAVLLVETSVDWTWSFPALLLAFMLVAGSSRPGGELRASRLVGVVGGLAILGAAVVLAAPYLSDRERSRADRLATSDPGRAADLGRTARQLNPWDDRVYALLGRLAAAERSYAEAAARYRKSASLSRQPWIAYLEEAEAWHSAGNAAETARACRLAQTADPLEPFLREGVCRGGS